MNIRNVKSYLKSLWDWSVFNDCFGDSNIRLSDVDGIAERFGQFLMVETKAPLQKVPRGQEILLRALARTGLFTILIVWGKPGKPHRWTWMTKQDTVKIVGDLEDLRKCVSHWYKCANSRQYEIIPLPPLAASYCVEGEAEC